MIVNSTAGLC